MNIKKWVVNDFKMDEVLDFSDELNIPFFLTSLLYLRGLNEKSDIKSFLSSNIDFLDPMSLTDMDKAVKRINKAIEGFEKICIYGDYDADGITSTSLLYLYLVERGANVQYYIPERDNGGYGLNVSAISALKEDDVSLIITVDNGVSAYDEVEHANSLGIDVVVTDHHQVPEKLPNAIAVVNPHRLESKIKFKNLAGVGVVFKLVCALESNLDVKVLLSKYSDLVAIGTLADIVTITGENRFLVQQGIRVLNNSVRHGLQSMLQICNLNKKDISSTHVSFSIVPRINASGRMSSASNAVKLLTSSDLGEANYISSIIEGYNQKRKEIENDIMLKVEELIKSNQSILNDEILVLDGENWHAGVIGIVAARIVNKYLKPCIIISREGDCARGSGRSFEGFSLYNVAKACRHQFIKFGGHDAAIGFDISVDKIDSFRQNINEVAKQDYNIPQSFLRIDYKLNPEEISVGLIEDIKRMEPFGHENPTPVFGLYNMSLKSITPVGNGNHLKLMFSKNNICVNAMLFRMSVNEFEYMVGDTLDLAVKLDKNEYRGIISVSIFIDDIKYSSLDEEDVIRQNKLYESIVRGEHIDCNIIPKIIPSREDFVQVYSYLKRNNGWAFKLENLFVRLVQKDIFSKNNEEDESLNFCKLRVVLNALESLEVINIYDQGDKYNVIVNHTNKKVDLESAFIIKLLKTCQKSG